MPWGCLGSGEVAKTGSPGRVGATELSWGVNPEGSAMVIAASEGARGDLGMSHLQTALPQDGSCAVWWRSQWSSSSVLPSKMCCGGTEETGVASSRCLGTWRGSRRGGGH